MPGTGFEAVLDLVEQAAHRAGAEMHRRVDGDDGRAFRGAIAFEDAQAELLHPGLARFGLHALGTRHHQAHVEEVVGVGIARIAHQEGVGAEQHRGIGFVAELRHHLVVKRRGIEEGPHTGQHGQQRAAGEAEGMEHRQRVEHDVGCREGDARRRLVAVGVEVPVRQHHALGQAFGA